MRYVLVREYDYWGDEEPRLLIYKYENDTWYVEKVDMTGNEWMLSHFQKEEAIFMGVDIVKEATSFEELVEFANKKELVQKLCK